MQKLPYFGIEKKKRENMELRIAFPTTNFSKIPLEIFFQIKRPTIEFLAPRYKS